MIKITFRINFIDCVRFMRSSKGADPYEYKDSWERFNETLLSDKEKCYSNLAIEDITEVNYKNL